jgi:hypothetical protein
LFSNFIKKRASVLALSIFWLLLAKIEYPCGSDFPVFEVWLVSVTAAITLFSWQISIKESIDPTSIRAVSILVGKSILNVTYAIGLCLLFLLPLAIISPTVHCFNERSYSAEIILFTASAREKISGKILKSGTLTNDYTEIENPEPDRIDYFNVTNEGMIMVHATGPDFTLLLTPSLENSQVAWSCKAFPIEAAPLSCR